MRFSVQPPPGQSAFDQWKDAMKAVARLPMGIPPEFRKKAWLSLADHYLVQLRVNWEKTVRFVFNERSNPDDDKLGVQIVKDLHRTGCSNFSGDDNQEDRAILKRVLLAYARWNKRVGYCQGFNVIAALLLNVMDRKEDDALKVMIYLIDSVLPESYFANNLRALSVDMAVFRDLLALTYPRLSKHLDRLQLAAQDIRTGACYEPPLTNVFTMQWFLTLFATCLPVNIVLRVWDSVLLEGSEILLRTALTIWGRLSKRIMGVSSADEFYCLMGELSSSVMQGTMLDGDALVKSIYSLGDFPLPHINELREKYTYNIRPFTPAGTSGKKSSSSRSVIKSMLGSDDDDLDDDDITAMACMPGEMNGSPSDISVMGPGVYGPDSDPTVVKGPMQMERMSTDINNLKLQYQRLKQRQQQAHIIIAAASAKKAQSASSSAAAAAAGKNVRQHQRFANLSPAVLLPNIESPTAMNHLFVGKAGKLPSSGKNRLVTDGPRISAVPTARKSGLLAKQLQAVANAQAVSKSQRMRSGNLRSPAAISTSSSSQTQTASTSPPSTTSSSLDLETAQSNLSWSAKTEEGDCLQTATGLCLERDEMPQNEHGVDSNVQQIERDHKRYCSDLKITTCSEDGDESQNSGDHGKLCHSDELLADSSNSKPKEIPENSSELCEIGILGSHIVPSNIVRNENVLERLEDNTNSAVELSEETTAAESCPSVETPTDSLIGYLDSMTTPISNALQEDSGIESSSTTSPSITPGKRLCQSESLGSSQTLHDSDNADEELLLSVETTFIPDATEKTISVSHVEYRKCVSECESVQKYQKENLTDENESVNTANTVPVLCGLNDNYVEDFLNLDSIFFGCDDSDNIAHLGASQEAKVESSRKSSSVSSISSDNSPDINTLLSIVATTSPQRKFIRSMSVAGDSYLPSPSLIETVSVPETLDVEVAGDGVVVSKNDLHGVKSLDRVDLDHSSGKTGVSPQSVNTPRKSKTSRELTVSKEKGMDTKDAYVEKKSCADNGSSPSDQSKHRLSSPSHSYPLTSANVAYGPVAASKLPPSKPFNPFPIKLFNANRAKTGLKLGLYTASTLQQLKGMKGKTS